MRSVNAFLLVLAASPLFASDPPIVWTAPSLVRIAKNAKADASREITIHAAKGESASFQIAVQAPAAANLTNVTVSASEFGGGIGASNVVMYREHYIHISADDASKPKAGSPVTNPPLGPGDYADGLSPLAAGVKFDVAARSTQPLWIDVNVPRSAAPGKYAARFTIRSDQGEAAVTAHLVVWNFSLPVQPALKSAFLMQNPTPALATVLLRHRLMPKHVSPAAEKDLVDLGLNITSFNCWGDPKDGAMKPPPDVKDLENEAAQHPRELPIYCFSADEISGYPSLYPDLKKWAANLHAAGIRQLVTMKPVPQLYCDRLNANECRRSAVDIWVVLPFQYDEAKAECRYVQMKGDEVWSYNTLVQDNYSPKWHIDFAPIDFRIQPGFINQSLGLTGLLYWRVDAWQHPPRDPNDVWRDAKRNPREGETKIYPGDGVLVYPGDLPSIRLKWLRDGVDDFDYIELLKKTGRGDLALSIARGVGADWHTWTRDPQALEAARLQLGYALERGRPGPQSPGVPPVTIGNRPRARSPRAYVRAPRGRVTNSVPPSLMVMSSTIKAILFGLFIAVSAFAQEPDLQRVVRQSPFIFYGTVRQTGAANVEAVPQSASNAIVRVDRVLSAPRSLGDFTGRDITVALQGASPKNGERAVFFTTGWIYGKTLAVREVSHLAATDNDLQRIGTQVTEAQRVNREQELAALLARAEAVAVGTIVKIEPVPRERMRLPLTEHDPELARAYLRVETMLKGQAPADRVITFLFARSRDVMWERSPKPKEGQSGIWILSRDEKEGLKLDAVTAFDPRDLQPASALDLIRRLLANPR